MVMVVIAAAAVGEIPDLGNLLAGEAVIFNQVFSQAAVDI